MTVALTSDACHKGLPKSPTGEIPQFKGEPGLGGRVCPMACANTLSTQEVSQPAYGRLRLLEANSTLAMPLDLVETQRLDLACAAVDLAISRKVVSHLSSE